MSPLLRRTIMNAALFLSPVVIAAPSAALADGARVAAKSEAAQPLATPTTAPPVATAPYRAHFGYCDLYVPAFFQPSGGTYDLVVHFHGVPNLQEENVDRARLNAVVVSMNLGISSGVFSNYFQNPRAFDNLLDAAQRELDKSGRAPGAHLGRIAVTAWSAGFGAVGAILKDPENVRRIDAVLLADGLHANYLANHVVNDAALTKYVNFANLAMRGERLFALTHSSIGTEGYPSTTETIGELLKLTSLEKKSTVGILGPRGMHPIYESHRGSFHVAGYEGIGKQDHVDHVKAMAETMLPYLKSRWSQTH